MSESALSIRIRRYLEKEGWWAKKLHGGAYQSPGLPDILAVRKRVILAIETKIGKRGITKLQKKQLNELCGQGAFCIAPRSWREFEKVVKFASGATIEMFGKRTNLCVGCFNAYLRFNCSNPECILKYMMMLPSRTDFHEQYSTHT